MELQIQLAQAVQVLNHDVLSCNRVAANHWLVQFQQTDAAWQVATRILTDSPLMHDFEVELFAAQILKRKIHDGVGALQPEGRSALQNALLLSATKYSSGPSQLLTQICLALAALIIRSPEARSLVQQLFGSLYELQRQGSGGDAVLELLTVLPEEVFEKTRINHNRRWHFSQELLRNSPSVLEFLAHLSENDQSKRGKILRCFLSWVRIGCLTEIDPIVVPGHPLIAYAFTCLQVPESFPIAIEVLAEVINRHEVVPPAILSQMVVVKDTLLLPGLVTGNETVVKGVCWLVAELGQAAPRLFALGSPEALSLAEAVLGCLTFRSSGWDIAESSLPFWLAIGESLLSASIDTEDIVVDNHLPVFTALLDAIVVRIQVGPHLYSHDDIDGSSGLPDSLAQFRVNLEETVVVVCRLLGPTQFVSQILGRLETPAHWQVLEAQFFLLHTASNVIMGGPVLDLSSLVNVFLAVSEARSTEATAGLNLLHRSAAQVLGSFAGWICTHPSVVLALSSFLATGLRVPVAASACATALWRISEEYTAAVSFDPANLECLLWIGEGAHKLNLSFKEEDEVLLAIGRALTMVSDAAAINDAWHKLLRPAYESLEALLVAEGRLKLHSAESAPLLEAGNRALHRLGTIVSQFQVDEAGLVLGRVISQFWPMLEQLLASSYMENIKLATETCKCLAAALQSGERCFVPLLPKLVKSLSESFLKYQTHVCFIKLGGTITYEHGQHKDYGSLFVEIARVFSAAETVAALSSSYACDQEPEVAAGYMHFMSTFIRSCHEETVAAADVYVEATLSKATVCCTVLHRGAALAAMSYISCFLERVLSSLKKYMLVDNLQTAILLRICSQCGESIISGMLYALLGPSAMSRVYKATTVLQHLAAVCGTCDRSSSKSSIIGWSSLQSWIISAIQALPSEYLHQGEAELMSATWLKTLRAAASDLNSLKGMNRRGGYGEGGRTLKRILREFVDQHRSSEISFARN